MTGNADHITDKGDIDANDTTFQRVFANEPLLEAFTLPMSTADHQLLLLKDDVLKYSFNISGNDTVLIDGRVQVGLEVVTDFLRVTLTILSVECQDVGLYEIVVKGNGTEERRFLQVSVSGELF